MNRTARILRTCLTVAMGLLFWGCAGKSTDEAPKFSPVGKHPTDWLSTHWSEYAKQPDQCATCHGSVKDPALAGGTSKVSCFTCHPKGPGHPVGWGDGSSHGRLGVQLTASAWTGLASCTKCHGTDYAGGLVQVSCTSCHTKAPHPNLPWRNAASTRSNHDATDISNAPECFKCHAAGANSTLKPKAAPLPGATPGCYNNTMCHDRNP